ncbi:MAG: efflux RND transporter periplasmic adaptor subunit [Phycisphaerae bacterium]|nr:efflux RND transporter periplasmic adaptor subunit [Phycisphaerae bacterium]
MRKYWNIIKWVVGVGFVLLLVCGGGAAFMVPMIQKQMEAQRERAMGTLVVVEPAKFGALVRTVSAPGTVSAKTTTNISSRVSAKINAIYAEEGSMVKEGDLLIQLDSLDLMAALDASKARFAADEASLKSAEASFAAEEARIVGARAAYQNAVNEFERQQSLFASGDVSQQSLDNARTEVDRTQSTYNAAMKNLEAVRANAEAAKARADASKAEVERSQRNVEYCAIKAPFSGLITRRIAQVGETALGTIQNAGTQLMVLEDTREMLVKARLAETDAPRVSADQKVRIFINGYPDEQFEGVVRRVGMTSLRWQADNTYYFEAEIVVDTKGKRLSTGTTANVDIEIETISNVLMVPSQAVLDKRIDSLSQELRENHPLVDREKTFARLVMLHRDGKVVYKPVKTIAGNINSTAISEGIVEGDPIIVGPFSALQKLADGAKVRTEADEKKAREKKEGKKDETAVAEKDEKKKTEESKPADVSKDEKKKSETGSATKSAAAS